MGAQLETKKVIETPRDFPSTNPVLTKSFRDPSGRLVVVKGRVLRIITTEGKPILDRFLSSAAAQNLVSGQRIVGTKVLGEAECRSLLETAELKACSDDIDVAMVVEHARLPFPSFPQEWSPELLNSAAQLTLELAERLLEDGLGLKDATPYNVLFQGPEPVFVDILSFESRRPGDAIWLPYAQFLRTFIIPLLLNKHFGLSPHQFFLTHRDGLSPEDLYEFCSPIRRLLPPFLTLISIPKWLGGTSQAKSTEFYTRKPDIDPERARFTLQLLFRGLRRTLGRAAPPDQQRSAWTGYMAEMTHYTKDQFEGKQAFVDKALREFRPESVLDVGCNTGFFSCLAAKNGARVVAIDSDPAVVDRVYRTVRKEKLDVLPLVVDLTRPTPAVGWRNSECSSFLDRACGSFDAVLMLAVIHHMLVTERVPLQDIIDLAADLTRDLVIIEFVGPEDQMFRRLTRGREELFTGVTRDVFEATASRRFETIRSEQLEAHRCIYLLKKVQRGKLG